MESLNALTLAYDLRKNPKIPFETVTEYARNMPAHTTPTTVAMALATAMKMVSIKESGNAQGVVRSFDATFPQPSRVVIFDNAVLHRNFSNL
jgi:hypothetical protein